MKKTFLSTFIVMITVFFICSPYAGAKTIKMAFMPGIADPFYFTMEKGAQAMAKELGVELIVGEYPKAWGPESQVPILEALIARGDIDLLLTAPTSSEALIPVLKKVHNKGIPVITVDTFIGDGDYNKKSDFSFPLAFIGTDNKLGGEVVAKSLAELIGNKGKVMIENTNPDTSSVVARGKGFTKGIDDISDVNVVAHEYCLDSQEKAQSQVSAILQKHPDLAGVFGVNVFSAQGAYRAIVNSGLKGSVKVATWDATEDLINALKIGEVDLVLAQKPGEIGSLAVEWGYKYLTKGTKIPNKKLVPGFFVFTKDNVNNPENQKYIYSK